MNNRREPEEFDHTNQKMVGIEDPGDIDYNKLSRQMGSDPAVATNESATTTSIDGNYGLDEGEYGSGGIIPGSARGDQFGGVRLTSGSSTVGTDDFTGDIEGEMNSLKNEGTERPVKGAVLEKSAGITDR